MFAIKKIVFYSKKRFILKIHLYTYSIVPSVLITISNLLIAFNFLMKRNVIHVKPDIGYKKKIQMTMTITILTLLFIIFTLPGAIISGYYFSKLIRSKFGEIILLICDNLTFSYHSFSLLILLASNKKFYKEFKLMFRVRNKSAGNNMNSTE